MLANSCNVSGTTNTKQLRQFLGMVFSIKGVVWIWLRETACNQLLITTSLYFPDPSLLIEPQVINQSIGKSWELSETACKL